MPYVLLLDTLLFVEVWPQRITLWIGLWKKIDWPSSCSFRVISIQTSWVNQQLVLSFLFPRIDRLLVLQLLLLQSWVNG